MMKISIIISIALVFVCSVTYFSIDQYNKYRSEVIVKETNLKLAVLKNKVQRVDDIIKETAFIMQNTETENLVQDLYVISTSIAPLENDIKTYITLGNSSAIRSKLEKGYDETNRSTPLDKIAVLIKDAEKIEQFCTNRETVRNRALRNELTLKAILKKPLVGNEFPTDLDKIMKYGKDLVSIIPQSNGNTLNELNSLNDKNLVNSLGVMLLKYKPILNDINSVAKTDSIKSNAFNMWDSAKKSYSKIKEINETIHWYDPKFDDGKYDGSKYAELLSSQANALNYYENGNRLLTNLENYLKEVKTQYVTYVSSNSYVDTEFRHSKTVYDEESYVDSNGDRKYRKKSRTKYYYTDGRIFYYTITNVNSNGRSENRIKIGEKDSYDIQNSFGHWRTYDYPPDKREGYLVKYKPYGYDNSSVVIGGRFNPSQHIIEQGK